LESPEKNHTVCGQRESSIGVRATNVDSCKVVAALNETPDH
jgi:hypothetical protein